jgi:F0F1-type ATP synthase assembly protein I
MKLPFLKLQSGRAHGPSSHAGDDGLGRGMDLALTVLVFLGIGYALDRWLGLFPLFTIGLVLFAAIGSFVRMKVVYDATMERLEAERAEGRTRQRSAA